MDARKGARKLTLAIERSLIRAGERVCVAASGGADSTALLLAMVEANAEVDPRGGGLGVVLSAAHVHHGLRGSEADGDEAFVRELCQRLGVPLTVFRVDTAARQAAEGEGVEEAARELRYAALRGLMEPSGVDVVATAHTLDDQAETVMMKLLRGAWTEGLGGISPVVVAAEPGSGNREQGLGKGRIVRPMLGLRRAQVEAFLRSREECWREDASNRDLTLTRNRVRHELMPVLRGFNPGIDDLLARMAAIAREEEMFWQAEVARILPQVLLPGKPVRGGGRAVSTAVDEPSCALEIARLRAMTPALRRRVVRAAAKTLCTASRGGGCRLSAEETGKVLALGGLGGVGRVSSASPGNGMAEGKPGSRLELRGGLRVERSARELRFWRLD
jgi:tRNA(Ile)-lysidine synthase